MVRCVRVKVRICYSGYWSGQLADTPTRGLPTSGLDNSRMPPATLNSFRSFGGICETASCPVRELTSPQVDQSARYPVRELAICKLSSNRYSGHSLATCRREACRVVLARRQLRFRLVSSADLAKMNVTNI